MGLSGQFHESLYILWHYHIALIISFVVSSEFEKHERSDSVLHFQDCFDYLGALAITQDLRIGISTSAKKKKKAIGILTRSALNL